MKKLLIILMMGIMMFGIVSAESIGVFKQNQEMQITNYCSTADCTYANLTRIILPNSTIINVNEEMTQIGNDFNYSYTPTLIGTYSFNTCSNPSGESVCDSDTFEVTTSGTQLNGSKTALNLGLLFLMLCLFVISLFTMFQLPNKKEIKDNGEIINRGWITYVKPILFILSWSLLMAIIFIASGIALQYLYFDMFGKLLFNLYKIMMGLTLPMIVIWLIWIFVSIFQDKETKRMIERGGDDFGQI
jgi:hypothetical protein